ncbi:MAG TPA: hypothetical protein VHL11_07695, partial [Phototrophicaceae bacterium]|nr:hypothetical protein [Phototrophicaceae bacterium]
LYPKPDERVYDGSVQDQHLCPSESLYPISNPPVGYDASGEIYAPVEGLPLWVIQPEDGSRREAPEVPQCSREISCQFSPDKSWILAQTDELIYVTRPDDSDQRVLWDLRTPYPETPVPYYLNWSGNQALEWQAQVEVTQDGTSYYQNGFLRDVLNVFPDPKPWFPEVEINEIPATFVSRQPGGPWAVAYTTYPTGLGTGYKFYLYRLDNGEYQLFAQDKYQPINMGWDDSGSRLFYSFAESDSYYTTYQVTFSDNRETVVANQYLGRYQDGEWSNEERYRVNSTGTEAYPIQVWDSQTGATRSYCLPETGARLYYGDFTWSPDSRYIALQAPLPKDENVEGVGQHTLILNVETGEVVDLTSGAGGIVNWAQEPGTYGSGRVFTPTPTPTFEGGLTVTLTPTRTGSPSFVPSPTLTP